MSAQSIKRKSSMEYIYERTVSFLTLTVLDTTNITIVFQLIYRITGAESSLRSLKLAVKAGQIFH